MYESLQKGLKSKAFDATFVDQMIKAINEQAELAGVPVKFPTKSQDTPSTPEEVGEMSETTTYSEGYDDYSDESSETELPLDYPSEFYGELEE